MKFHPNSILTVDDIRDVEEAVLNAVINGYELEDISLGEMVDSGVEFKFDIDDLETFDLGLIDKAFERVFFLYTEAKTYEVGGAVRDRLMGRVAKDTDYCVVGATPEKMLKHGFVQVGAAFPVFLHPATRDEYALARRERKTGDGYHGFEVEFGTDVTIEEDLGRRDLTINAIAYDNVDAILIDPFKGVEDIEIGRLRMVDAGAFAEDPLRVVRVLRFAARYKGFIIDSDTWMTMRAMMPTLKELPSERFHAELVKLYEDVGMDASCLDIFWTEVANLDFAAHVPFFKGFDSRAIMTMSERYNMLLRMKDKVSTVVTPIDVLNVSMCDVIGITEDALHFFSEVKALKAVADEVEKLMLAPVLNEDEIMTGLTKAYLKLRIHQQDNDTLARLGDLLSVANGTQYMTFLRDMGKRWAEVKADQFPGLEGKQLGEAIFTARKNIFLEIAKGE